MSEAAGPAPCPICGKPRVEKYRPFCSARCADIDLNRWLTGRYAIPATEVEDAADDLTAEDIEKLANASGQRRDEPL
ncbi:MAG: DNA gyrase inhibitor YacG [Rhodobiaceae bacterium]|nr:DNA gyrase inhibitor YacG [Rhodobiaceae bacterium]